MSFLTSRTPWIDFAISSAWRFWNKESAKPLSYMSPRWVSTSMSSPLTWGSASRAELTLLLIQLSST